MECTLNKYLSKTVCPADPTVTNLWFDACFVAEMLIEKGKPPALPVRLEKAMPR